MGRRWSEMSDQKNASGGVRTSQNRSKVRIRGLSVVALMFAVLIAALVFALWGHDRNAKVDLGAKCHQHRRVRLFDLCVSKRLADALVLHLVGLKNRLQLASEAFDDFFRRFSLSENVPLQKRVIRL